MTSAAVTRSKLTYPIPCSSLTLHLTLGHDLPLPIASIRSCLSGATTIARSNRPDSLTTAEVLRFQQPGHEEDNDATFGVVGDVVFGDSEMNWGDVVEVTRGLATWAEEREEKGEQSVAFWFQIEEEDGRGHLGDGYLVKRDGE